MPLLEVVNRTLAGFENLGAQVFATPPYSQHYERWIRSLITVLDDFEASPAVKADDGFHEARGGILEAVEAALKAGRTEEAEREAKMLAIRGSKDMLLQAEAEHDARLRELSARRDEKLKSLAGIVEVLSDQQTDMKDEKPGILERFTKKKAQREEEMGARIASAEGVLDAAKEQFNAESARLQAEYAERKRAIMGKVAEERKQIEALEAEADIDRSVEVRRVACEELAESVKALVTRLETQPDSS